MNIKRTISAAVTLGMCVSVAHSAPYQDPYHYYLDYQIYFKTPTPITCKGYTPNTPHIGYDDGYWIIYYETANGTADNGTLHLVCVLPHGMKISPINTAEIRVFPNNCDLDCPPYRYEQWITSLNPTGPSILLPIRKALGIDKLTPILLPEDIAKGYNTYETKFYQPNAEDPQIELLTGDVTFTQVTS